MEGAAVRAAYTEILSQAHREKVGALIASEPRKSDDMGTIATVRRVFKYLREGRDVMSTATFTEAFSGVLSSGVGLIGLGLSYHLQSGVPDVVASICMASIVSGVSVFLLQKSGNALLGETLPRWRVKALIDKLEAHVAVVNVYDVKTELVGVDTVRFKAEVQFNPQAITERILQLNTAEEEPDPSGMDAHVAHAVLASQLQGIIPQLRRGFSEPSVGEDPAATWLFRNNNLFYEALAWELKDVERALRSELQDFKNVHIDLEPW
ncbi:Slc30a9 [Symbiodinium sp. CCMP2592]|nr:Slc30a9 [Symbiodinium sp. CCMP2592]